MKKPILATGTFFGGLIFGLMPSLDNGIGVVMGILALIGSVLIIGASYTEGDN